MRPQPGWGAETGITLAAWVLVAALFVFLFKVAYDLRLEYFDNYSVLQNARAFASRTGADFYWKRFIFLPVLLSPLFALETLASWDSFGFVASHFVSVCFFAGLLGACYRLFRLSFGRREALGGVFLMATNRLLIHFAPFVKEDIPATFFTVLAFYFYLKTRRSGKIRDYLLTSAFIPMAMATRYNLIPLLMAVIVLNEMLSFFSGFCPKDAGARTRRALWGLLFYIFLPALLFGLVPAVVFSYLGLTSFSGGTSEFFEQIRAMRQMNMTPEPPSQNFFFLAKAATWPVFFLAVYGFFSLLKRRSPQAVFHALWLLVFFAFQTWVIHNKEARYLFILYPPFYFFAAGGFFSALGALKNRLGASKRFFGAALVFGLLVVALPVASAVRECLRFRDPLYYSDFARKVSGHAARLAGDGRIFWLGHFYGLHTRDYVFDREDEFTYFYHMFNHTVRYYTGKPVMVLANTEGKFDFSVIGVSEEPLFLLMDYPVGLRARDGDVLIVNPEASAYNTRDVPDSLKPLWVQRVKTHRFKREAQTAGGYVLYRSGSWPEGVLSAGLGPEGFKIEGIKCPDGFYQLYLSTPLRKALMVAGWVYIRNGAFERTIKDVRKPIEIDRIELLSFESAVLFDPGS